MSDSVPKMPRLMKRVYEQIFARPLFNNLSNGAKFALVYAGACGLSECTRRNNEFARKYWNHLYLNDVEPR